MGLTHKLHLKLYLLSVGEVDGIPSVGVVKVSTGVLKLVKLFAGDASNHNLNINANNDLAYAA